MRSKKLLALLLSLSLLLCLAACGEEPVLPPSDVDIWLEPSEADMSGTAFAILDSLNQTPFICRWVRDDVISWKLDLPAEGIYTIRFLYSTDENYEQADALFSFRQEGEVIGEERLSFPATGRWYRSDIAECTVLLPQGEVELSMRADIPADSPSHFINLQRIQICTDDVTPIHAPVENDSETNAALVAGAWSAVSSGAPDEIHSLLVSPEGDSVTLFDGSNQAVLTFDCRVEAGLFIIYDGYYENCYSITEEGLADINTGEPQWVRSDNSNLETKESDYDGLWYLNGDPDSTCYEISGSSCRKMAPTDGDYTEELSASLVYDYSVMEDNGVPFPNHLTLEIGDTDLELTPTADGTMLIEADFFDYQVYVRADLADSEHAKACQALAALMNDSCYYKDEAGDLTSFTVTPNCFFVRLPDDTQFSGLWKLVDGTLLELSFEDGDVETIDLSVFGGQIYLSKFNLIFDHNA